MATLHKHIIQSLLIVWFILFVCDGAAGNTVGLRHNRKTAPIRQQDIPGKRRVPNSQALNAFRQARHLQSVPELNEQCFQTCQTAKNECLYTCEHSGKDPRTRVQCDRNCITTYKKCCQDCISKDLGIRR